MDHLRRLGNSISIPIPADENAFTGRECPQPDCEGYFKIELGTGLKGQGLPCHCPYCGHTAGHDQFWTKEQIEYAKSVAMRKITDALHKDLVAYLQDKELFVLDAWAGADPTYRLPIRVVNEYAT